MIPAPLRLPGFRAFWLARLLTTIAQMAMVIVIGWQVYDIARESMPIHDAAFQLGLIGLVQFIPLFILTPVSGWVADRLDRRHIARAVILLEMLCALSLFWATWSGHVSLPILFSIAALLGVARAFAGPALGALAPNLVPRDLLPRAIALSSTAWQAGAIAGPAIGGFLYDVTPHLPYAFSAALFGVSAVCLFLVGPVPRSTIAPGKPIQRMVEGLRYVRRNRLVLGAITLDLFAVLLGGATAMLPLYARDILHVGVEGLGPLRAAPALGATVTAIVFSIYPLRTNVGVKMLAAVVIFGAATAIFGISTYYPLSLAMLAILGAADMFSVYIRQSLIQLHTPDAMRGRVSAASTLAISASNELGETRSGFAAAFLGPVVATTGGGVAAVLVTLTWAAIFPELRRARTFESPEEPPPDGSVIPGGV
ncbi:MFS transporter [Sphingomonas sabuli]|uniref:Multidrug efflux pump Tap n=1 Tax=Sphingomonas sabuli TaxID=2764186 RepID=A0A7G9L216_9SPHN|nr:MFS transporter [Sphingomonas sabuli]QNM82665.1 MFS transporter [Sphingomonas sabuli]